MRIVSDFIRFSFEMPLLLPMHRQAGVPAPTPPPPSTLQALWHRAAKTIETCRWRWIDAELQF